MNRPATEFCVRPMSLADVDWVMEIARSLPEAPHWPATAYLTALDKEATPRRISLVAADVEAGTVLGFLVAGVLAPQGELETIAVALEARRRGVGGRLFAAMVEEMKQAGVREIILEVRASNLTALGFYRALGFVEMGCRPRYYGDPVEDAVLLGLRLGVI